jgi:alkyl sulfatase BDS1-like metallo-beta-lactamase superfamily hydrolase
VKAVYQRYMGWYDGNPAHLWPHPPVERAQRYVASMGGADAVVASAQTAFDEGDYRWVVDVLDHVLFADEHHPAARALQADAFEQLGFGAESGTWRNVYLAGATELRHGSFGTPTTTSAPDVANALSVEQILSAVAVRIDGPKAWDEHVLLSFVVTDTGQTHVVEVRHGTLNQRITAAPAPGSTTFTLERRVLIGLVMGTVHLPDAIEDGTVAVDGDLAALGRLVSLTGAVDRDFPIVTP